MEQRRVQPQTLHHPIKVTRLARRCVRVQRQLKSAAGQRNRVAKERSQIRERVEAHRWRVGQVEQLLIQHGFDFQPSEPWNRTGDRDGRVAEIKCFARIIRVGQHATEDSPVGQLNTQELGVEHTLEEHVGCNRGRGVLNLSTQRIEKREHRVFPDVAIFIEEQIQESFVKSLHIAIKQVLQFLRKQRRIGDWQIRLNAGKLFHLFERILHRFQERRDGAEELREVLDFVFRGFQFFACLLCRVDNVENDLERIGQ